MSEVPSVSAPEHPPNPTDLDLRVRGCGPRDAWYPKRPRLDPWTQGRTQHGGSNPPGVVNVRCVTRNPTSSPLGRTRVGGHQWIPGSVNLSSPHC